jgi:hypothetical protein
MLARKVGLQLRHDRSLASVVVEPTDTFL